MCTAHPGTLRHRTTAPSLLHRRRHWLGPAWSSGSPAPSYNAAEYGEDNETTNASADANDEVLIVMYPAADLFGCSGTFAFTLLHFISMIFGDKIEGSYVAAFPTTTAYSAVEEVLLHTVAHSWAKFRRSTRKRAILAIASISVILGSVGPHERLALLVP